MRRRRSVARHRALPGRRHRRGRSGDSQICRKHPPLVAHDGGFMIAVVSAAWAVVRSWLSGIPLRLGMAIGAAALAGAFAFTVYKAGRAAAEADELRKLAADNAAVAAQYREHVVQAQDAVARE